jgi:glycosyltransferase involved in cell wall biosynthesis
VKIALYVCSFLPQVGGRELVVFHLAKAMQSLGHEVRVVGPAGWRAQRHFSCGVPVHRQPATVGFEVWERYARNERKHVGPRGLIEEKAKQLQLLWNLKRWGCDVVHAHSTYPNGYNAARLGRLLNSPLVITPHGEDINTVPAIGFGLRLNPLLEPRIRYALATADAATAISSSIEAALVNAGAPAERVHRIPNGVDLARFEREPRSDISRLLGSKAGRLITSIGNYHPRKGHEVAIDAMPSILVHHPDVRLVIVGRDTETLRPLVDKLGLHDNVILAGLLNMPHGTEADGADVLANLLRRSSLYLSTGIEEGAEGLSLAVLEATAAGLPVVATRISGNRDIVSDGSNGILVEPGNPRDLAQAVVALLDDESRRAALARGARATAKRFDWIEIAGQYLSLYGELAARRKALRHKGRALRASEG